MSWRELLEWLSAQWGQSKFSLFIDLTETYHVLIQIVIEDLGRDTARPRGTWIAVCRDSGKSRLTSGLVAFPLQDENHCNKLKFGEGNVRMSLWYILRSNGERLQKNITLRPPTWNQTANPVTALDPNRFTKYFPSWHLRCACTLSFLVCKLPLYTVYLES